MKLSEYVLLSVEQRRSWSGQQTHRKRNAVRDELAPFEGEFVVVRGTLKESRDGPDKLWNLLFVNCVLKPLGDPDTPLSEVEAGPTDHVWVRVDERTLQRWKGQNADGLLLKKLEYVFRVERHRRKDGSQDLGLALPDEQWFLASSTVAELKALKRKSRELKASEALRNRCSGPSAVVPCTR